MNQQETKPMPAPSSGNSLCGDYAGLLGFDNGGQTFTPNAGTTKCVAKVQVGSKDMKNTEFYLLWVVTISDSRCAKNVSGSATDKSFPSDPKKAYTFTVFFIKGHVPAPKTKVTLKLNFQ